MKLVGWSPSDEYCAAALAAGTCANGRVGALGVASRLHSNNKRLSLVAGGGVVAGTAGAGRDAAMVTGFRGAGVAGSTGFTSGFRAGTKLEKGRRHSKNERLFSAGAGCKTTGAKGADFADFASSAAFTLVRFTAAAPKLGKTTIRIIITRRILKM